MRIFTENLILSEVSKPHFFSRFFNRYTLKYRKNNFVYKSVCFLPFDSPKEIKRKQ